jgi:hypothetical protein
VAALVLEYYVVLRSVLRAKPHLRRCRTRCPHCGIFFLTHPCNVNQRGLIRCPFGCRQEHRRRKALGRSSAYYKGKDGKEIKKRLNQRRCRLPPRQASQAPRTPLSKGSPGQPKRSAAEGRCVWSHLVMLQHVRMVVSLIEGRRVSRRQVRLMLAKILRQHTLTRRRQIEQTVLWLHKQPP